MSIFGSFDARVREIVAKLVSDGIVDTGADLSRITVEPPSDPAHGDLSTNAALVLAGHSTRCRVDLARHLADALARTPEVETAEVAGPGFVNLRLHPMVWQHVLQSVVEQGRSFGRGVLRGRRFRIDCAALPPAGARTIAEGRRLVVTEALAGLMEFAGAQVTRTVGSADAIVVTDDRSVPRHILCGQVRVLRKGAVLPRSAQGFETLCSDVGGDALALTMLMCRTGASLDLDLDAAADEARSNPAFSIPYAHALTRLLERRAATMRAELQPVFDAPLDSAAPLDDPGERALAKLVALFPRLVEQAAAAHDPHRLTLYLHSLATGFHTQYNRGMALPHLRFIRQDDRRVTLARMILVRAVETVLASGLGMLGIVVPDEIR